MREKSFTSRLRVCKSCSYQLEKAVNLIKSCHQHFSIKDGNQEGKNKEQINIPPCLHAILLLPNYLHVQNPIFCSTQSFTDSNYTPSSATLNTIKLSRSCDGDLGFIPLEKIKQHVQGVLMSSMSYVVIFKEAGIRIILVFLLFTVKVIS